MKKPIITIIFSLFLYTLYGQCPEPSNETFLNITETTADLSWTENGSATNWEVEIVLAGDAPSGTGIATTTNPFIATSLVSGQAYDFYVRSNCMANGFSQWRGPFTVTTLSCIFSIDAVETPGSCLDYCFYANGAQFGTFFDFNSGVLPVGWNSSPFTVGAPCLTNMIDNSPYFWAGVTDNNGERVVTTNPLDVTLGGIVQFFMRYGADDPDPGCETSDLPEEGVNLQYSTNGGATWVNMNYWQPTDILTDDLYSWTQYTEIIPPGAQTNNTIFRWYQSDNSGPQFDNWGLDNVLVSANTTANYLWDFGDGNTSTDSAPCHAYATPGPYVITLTVDSPNCNNTVTTNIVADDTVPPSVVCQNLDISLDLNGVAVITPADIDNGSFDNCGIQSMTLSQTNFDCTDVGVNTVTLTVVDVNGNTDSCTASVIINQTLIDPASVVILPLTSTSAEITWTPNSSETSWEIEIVPAGTIPTGTGIATSTIPYVATNLTANTDYDLYIIGVFGASTCTDFSGPINFSTPCDVLAVPYVETVETQILGSASAIDDCWSAADTSFSWRANSLGTPSTGTGPNAAANGTNYFYTEASGAATGEVAELLSPFFDLTTSSNTYLHFFYHMFGGDMGELHVDVFDGAAWVNDIFVLVGEQQGSNNADWIQQYIDISAYETVANFQVRFRGIRGPGFTSDMAIDDVTIESVTCPNPFNLVASNATATTIDLSWSVTGTETQWEIEAIPTGTPPTGSGIAVTTNPYTYTGLNPNTTYDFYIRANCGPGDDSDWIGPVTFPTTCTTFSVPYVEPVETQVIGGALGIANCWSADDTNFQWRVNSNGTPSTGTGPNAAANGTNYFYTEATGASTGDVAILLSPFFDLTTSSNTFLHFNYHMYGSDMGELHVDVFNGTVWVNDIFVLTGQQQTSNAAAWIQEFIDISAYETVPNFQVRFRGIRGSGFRSDMAIDDITIESIIGCPEPINFTASNPTATTIDLSWTESGTATQWEIEAVPTGTTPTGSAITVTTNPFTYTGLLPNVTYDFYIRANCGPGDDSDWVGPITLMTVCDDISFDFCPTNITIATTSGQCYGIPNYTLPTVIDNCAATNPNPTLTQGLAPNGQFPIGVTTVSYSATNSVGTTVTCSFDVTVTDPFVGLTLQVSEPVSANTVTLCNEDTLDLSIVGGSFDGSETYEWLLDGTAINGETTSTLSAINSSGMYTGVLTLGTCSMSFAISVNQFTADPSFVFDAVDCDFATVRWRNNRPYKWYDF